MTTSLDKYGRILIPKKLREMLGLNEHVRLQLRQQGDQIIIEPLKNDTYYQEKDGFLFYTGSIDSSVKDLVEEGRSSRYHKLLGL